MIHRSKKFSPILIFVTLSVLMILSACQPKQGLAEQSLGASLFETNCQSCHELPKPTDYSDLQWPIYTQKYGEKIKLSSIEIETLTEYLLANN